MSAFSAATFVLLVCSKSHMPSPHLPVDTRVCADFLPVHSEVPHVPHLHRLVVTGRENYVSGRKHRCIDSAVKDKHTQRERETLKWNHYVQKVPGKLNMLILLAN